MYCSVCRGVTVDLQHDAASLPVRGPVGVSGAKKPTLASPFHAEVSDICTSTANQRCDGCDGPQLAEFLGIRRRCRSHVTPLWRRGNVFTHRPKNSRVHGIVSKQMGASVSGPIDLPIEGLLAQHDS